MQLLLCIFCLQPGTKSQGSAGSLAPFLCSHVSFTDEWKKSHFGPVLVDSWYSEEKGRAIQFTGPLSNVLQE